MHAFDGAAGDPSAATAAEDARVLDLVSKYLHTSPQAAAFQIREAVNASECVTPPSVSPPTTLWDVGFRGGGGDQTRTGKRDGNIPYFWFVVLRLHTP